MNIAIATDYKGAFNDPEDSIRRIAAAGFTHLHWCHQWCTDHLYSDREIAKISAILNSTGLKLLDIHGSDGGETSSWYSSDEVYRKAGVELVMNRLRMHAMLRGEGTMMMHIPSILDDMSEESRNNVLAKVDALRRSLDELVPAALGLRIPFALENMVGDTFEVLSSLFAEYPKEAVGLCYDSGHGNVNFKGKPCHGLERMEKHLDRLQALHLHDNDGSGDQHRPPFFGNVDWTRLSRDIRSSAYPRIFSFELSMQNGEDPDEFLRDAYDRCKRVASLPLETAL